MSIIESFTARIKKASACLATLNGVAEIGIHFRGTGITTALVAAAAEKPGAVIVTHDRQYGQLLQKTYPNIEFDTISLAETKDKLVGLPRNTFVVLDNGAITAMAAAAAESVEELRKAALQLIKEVTEAQARESRLVVQLAEYDQENRQLRVKVEMLEKQLVGNAE